MRYVIEYKPQRGKPIHISRAEDWSTRGRLHPNGWCVIGIAGTTRDAVVIAERYCRRNLASDLQRRLLQKVTLSPEEKRFLQKLKRHGWIFPDRARAGCR